jgi:SAM-dependent methyltransferase
MMSSDVAIVFALLSAGGLLLVLILFHEVSKERPALSFRITEPSTYGLVLASAAGLYLELLLIRWISSEIRVFAYFKNFVLIACFLGFGIGCYLGRRAISAVALLAPLLYLVAVIQMPWPTLRHVVDGLPVLLGATSEMHIWGVNPLPFTPVAMAGLGLAAVVILPMFALIAIAFIPIGQLVGWYLENAPNGIRAYSINVLASLAGIALYTALCFANQPPIVWFAVGAVLLFALFRRTGAVQWVTLGVFIVLGALLAIKSDGPTTTTYWSPYQKLALTPRPLPSGELAGYSLETNGSWYQKIVNLSPEFLLRHGREIGETPQTLNSYNLPYLFQPNPPSVLILGAGMGNDVAAALRNGAGRVTAVEIDPLILRLGRELHPEKPYSSPRVTVTVDDARSYLQNSNDRFNLIVFSLLDSHTTTSHFSNIRIDNYVYTIEALRAAKKLLAPGGVFIIKFQVERPWIAGRLHDVMVAAFGSEPLHLEGPRGFSTTGRFFIAGPPDRIAQTMRDPKLQFAARVAASRPMEHASVTTDDWPYFYQRARGVPASVVTISILLIIVSLLAAGRLGIRPSTLRAEFFFLGAAFLLMEVQIVSRMALLFGTTWVVNSIVIAVLLLLIVAANGVAAKFPAIPVGAAYAGIIVVIAINYALPYDALFFRSFALRAILSTLILTLPVFFAGIVFIRRFAASGFSAEAIGSNLLGSLGGGLAESLSLWLGLKSLLIVAAVLYASAWLVSRRTA